MKIYVAINKLVEDFRNIMQCTCESTSRFLRWDTLTDGPVRLISPASTHTK